MNLRSTFIILMCLPLTAIAGGGKVREQNPIITTGGCVISVPSGIDTADCEEDTPSGNGRVKSWFCPETVLVTCVDEE